MKAFIKELLIGMLTMAIWIGGGKYLSGLLFPTISLSYPAQVPLLMLLGFVLGLVCIFIRALLTSSSEKD